MKSSTSDIIQMLTISMDKISHAKTPYEINDIMVFLLKHITNSDCANVYLYDIKRQALMTKTKPEISLSMNSPQGLLGNTFLSTKPSYFNHPVSHKDYYRKIDNNDNIKLKCQMIVPILHNHDLIGMIRVSRDIYHDKHYCSKDLNMIQALHAFIVKIMYILSSDDNFQNKITIDTNEIKKEILVKQNSSQNFNNNNALMILSNSVHDIRTPANTLYGFLELLEDQLDDKRLKEFVKNAKESAAFINTLTDSILEQAKESYISSIPKLMTVSSVKYFSQIANMFTANMFDKNINYLVYIDPSIPKEIHIDDHKLKRILTNLIGNAYKFTPTGKSIYFYVKYNISNNLLDISVVDTGIGINLTQQKEIFNVFTQAKEDIDDKIDGYGLGLSISSKYVKSLGGHLKLVSTLDVGSTFYFTIPIEIISPLPSYENFKNLNKKITILTDNNNVNIDNIYNYLVDLGMPRKKIVISNRLEKDTTHLFCFESKLSDEVLTIVKDYNMKILIIEKKLFSLSRKIDTSFLSVISENTYYGDMIHSTVFSEKKKRILIADDNKVNITLLKYMLETDYVDITSVSEGEAALNLLKKSWENNNHFDIVLLDKHMPLLTGTQVIQNFRAFEKVNGLKPIFAISITGDNKLDESEENLYDLMLRKPFNKQKVRDAIRQLK